MTHNFENQPAKHERAERTMQTHHHEAAAQALHSDAYHHGVTGNTKDRNPFPGNHNHHLPHLHIHGHDHKHHEQHPHHGAHPHHEQHPHHGHTGVSKDGEQVPKKPQTEAPKSPEPSLPIPKSWEQPPTNKSPYGGLQDIPNYVMSFPKAAAPDSPARVQPTYPGRDGSHI